MLAQLVAGFTGTLFSSASFLTPSTVLEHAASPKASAVRRSVLPKAPVRGGEAGMSGRREIRMAEILLSLVIIVESNTRATLWSPC